MSYIFDNIGDLFDMTTRVRISLPDQGQGIKVTVQQNRDTQEHGRGVWLDIQDTEVHPDDVLDVYVHSHQRLRITELPHDAPARPNN